MNVLKNGSASTPWPRQWGVQTMELLILTTLENLQNLSLEKTGPYNKVHLLNLLLQTIKNRRNQVTLLFLQIQIMYSTTDCSEKDCRISYCTSNINEPVTRCPHYFWHKMLGFSVYLKQKFYENCRVYSENLQTRHKCERFLVAFDTSTFIIRDFH